MTDFGNTEFGRGSGPKNWRGWGVLSGGYDGWWLGCVGDWIRVFVMVSRGEESDVGRGVGMGYS